MSVKREISTSVVNLQEFKRLAVSTGSKPSFDSIFDTSREMINQDGARNQLVNVPQNQSQNVLTVMSAAGTDFDSQYEKIREIGRGGFSTVFQCKNRSSGHPYAVKVSLFYVYFFNIIFSFIMAR